MSFFNTGVDFEVIYEPRKDEADPLDYISRHYLPDNGNDDTEKLSNGQ